MINIDEGIFRRQIGQDDLYNIHTLLTGKVFADNMTESKDIKLYESEGGINVESVLTIDKKDYKFKFNVPRVKQAAESNIEQRLRKVESILKGLTSKPPAVPSPSLYPICIARVPSIRFRAVVIALRKAMDPGDVKIMENFYTTEDVKNSMRATRLVLFKNAGHNHTFMSTLGYHYVPDGFTYDKSKQYYYVNIEPVRDYAFEFDLANISDITATDNKTVNLVMSGKSTKDLLIASVNRARARLNFVKYTTNDYEHISNNLIRFKIR